MNKDYIMSTKNNRGTFKEFLYSEYINTFRPRQNGRRFTDDTFKRIFLNENIRISIMISLKFVLRVQLTIIHHWFR